MCVLKRARCRLVFSAPEKIERGKLFWGSFVISTAVRIRPVVSEVQKFENVCAEPEQIRATAIT